MIGKYIDWGNPPLSDVLKLVRPQARGRVPSDNVDNVIWFLRNESAIADLEVNGLIGMLPKGTGRRWHRDTQQERNRRLQKDLQQAGDNPRKILSIWMDTFTSVRKHQIKLEEKVENTRNIILQ